MTDICLSTIRLSLKQRTWVMAYLIMDTPHDPHDLFCMLLMDLMAQPLAAGEELMAWPHLKG